MEKQRWEESEKRRAEERRSEKRKSQKKEDAGARKGRDVAKHCVFPMICGSGGSQSRLAEAAGAEPSGQMRDEKLHAYVARSTFRSQNVQNTFKTHHSRTTLEVATSQQCTPLWQEAHLEAKCTKHTILGPLLANEILQKCAPFWREAHLEVTITKHCSSGALLEVEMSKKCTPLWCEAHFEVKSVKNWRVRSTFGRSDVVSRGRGKRLCTLSKVSKTWGFCSSFSYSYNHH